MLGHLEGYAALVATRLPLAEKTISEQKRGGSEIHVKVFLELLALEPHPTQVVIAGHLLAPLGLAVSGSRDDGHERRDPLVRLVEVLAEVGDVARALPAGSSRAHLLTQIAEARHVLDALAADVHRERP